jgi:hypothetical protein
MRVQAALPRRFRAENVYLGLAPAAGRRSVGELWESAPRFARSWQQAIAAKQA